MGLCYDKQIDAWSCQNRVLTKDPTLRTGKIGTGSPGKYEIVYDVLVNDPQPIEQRVHNVLAHKREGKEWFRCAVGEAINEIRRVVGKNAITENVSDHIDDIHMRSAQDLPPIDRHLQKSTSRYYSIAKLKEEMEQIRKRDEGK
jgi:hypothetical protein